MILVNIDGQWFKTRAHRYVGLAWEIKSIAGAVYDTDTDVFESVHDENVKVQAKLLFWLTKDDTNDYKAFPYINTRDTINTHYPNRG